MKNVCVLLSKHGNVVTQTMDTDGKWVEEVLLQKNEELPEWCKLSYSKCPQCLATTNYCLVAVAIKKFVNFSSTIKSTEKVHLTIITEDGHIVNRGFSAQEGLSVVFLKSIMMSGCSHFKKYSWLYDRYRVVSDIDGLFYIMLSSYLTIKFVTDVFGSEKYDIKEEFIKETNRLIEVVKNVFKRISLASEQDANLNALVRIDSVARLLGSSFDEFRSNLLKKLGGPKKTRPNHIVRTNWQHAK